MKCKQCNHIHEGFSYQYRTENQGVVQTPLICGIKLSEESVCWCDS
jgi:RNase P subunit RPR2